MTIANLHTSALLSQGSYAEFATHPLVVDALVERTKGDFSNVQAGNAFVLHTSPPQFKGIELVHHHPNDHTGLSATLFFDRAQSKHYLAIRGTDDALDIPAGGQLVSSGFASDQFLSLYRYYRQLTTPAGQAVQYSTTELRTLLGVRRGVPGLPGLPLQFFHDTLFARELANDRGIDAGQAPGASVLSPSERLIVTGHSLGGHLAQVFGRVLPSVTEHVYTFNAPGVSVLGNWVLRSLGAPANANATHAISDVGADLLVLPGTHAGVSLRAFIEGGTSDPLHYHSIIPLADSLALHDAFARLSPTLDGQLATLGRVIAAASADPAESLEGALDALRRLLTPATFLPTLTAASRFDLGQRDSYYANLYGLLDATANGSFRIEPLVGLGPAELLRRAQESTAVRYALRELVPFAVEGADFAAQAPSIALYDQATGAGALSQEWLAARAELLALVLEANEKDRRYGRSDAPESVLYVDADKGLRFSALSTSDTFDDGLEDPVGPEDYLAGTSYGRVVAFGSEGGDTLAGLAGNDRVFGAAGADALSGGDGADLLEGGAGADVLEGGAGDDVLAGGADADVLRGGTGFDLYRLGAQLEADVIGDSDGEGLVIAGDKVLTGGYRVAPGLYSGGDGFTYSFAGDLQSGGTLIVNDALAIEGFRDGDLGIRLAAVERPAAVTAAVGFMLFGDLAPFDVDPPPPVNPVWGSRWVDTFGNGLRSGNPLPELPDGFRGRPGDTAIFPALGNDVVEDQYSGNDWIDAGDGDDVAHGGRDHDLIEGGPGNDLLLGGPGNDRLYANYATSVEADLSPAAQPGSSRGADWLSGGEGDDVLYGDAEANVLDGGHGSDTVFGGAGDDWIGALEGIATGVDTKPERMALNSGEPLLVLGNLSAIAFGGWDFRATPATPSQTIARIVVNHYGEPVRLLDASSMAGTDRVDAGPGNDVVGTGAGDDVVLGGPGNDDLAGSRGSDALFGGEGNDRIYGDIASLSRNPFTPVPPGVHEDFLYGGDGDDALWGQFGRDQLFGGAGNDLLVGGQEDDLLLGEAGDDVLEGISGNDYLAGGAGNDALSGFWGDDTLDGGPGADRLDPGTGRDRILWGRGHGADTVAWTTPLDSASSLTIEMAADTLAGDVVVTRPSQGGWMLAIRGSEDSLSLAPFNPALGVTVEFADGAALSLVELESRGSGQDAAPSDPPPAPFTDLVVVDGSAPQMASDLGTVRIEAGESFSFALPRDLASDVDAGDTLTWFALTGDAEALPQWLHFDAEALTLSGDVPGTGDTSRDIVFIAADNAGQAAATVLHLEVAQVEQSPVPQPSGEESVPAQESAAPPMAPASEPAPPFPFSSDVPPPQSAAATAATAPLEPLPSAATAQAPPPIIEPADSVYAAIEARLEIPVHPMRFDSFVERYQEAVEAFEAKRREREAPPEEPPPLSEDEIARYNTALHAWLDRDAKRAAFLGADESGGADWFGGFQLAGTSLAPEHAHLESPGLRNPATALARPGLAEGLSDLRS